MLFTDYYDLYTKILDLSDGPQEDENFLALPPAAQNLCIVAIFDMEIMNGGLCQFFANCGIAYAERVGECLRAVGLPRIADLYEKFLADNEIDRSVMQTMQLDFSDEEQSTAGYQALEECYPYEDFDDAYQDIWEEDDFETAMTTYANAHSGLFDDN